MTAGEATREPVARGWYQRSDDPHGVQRWFDGTTWTERTTGRSREAATAESQCPRGATIELSPGVSVTTSQPYVPPPSGRGWHEYPGDPAGVQRWYTGSTWTNRLTGGTAVERAHAVALPGLPGEHALVRAARPNTETLPTSSGFIPMMYNPTTGESAYVDPSTGRLRVRPRYGNGRRVGYSLLWAFYAAVLAIGGIASLGHSQVPTGLVGLLLSILSARYAFRIWTYRARTLWLLLFF